MTTLLTPPDLSGTTDAALLAQRVAALEQELDEVRRTTYTPMNEIRYEFKGPLARAVMGLRWRNRQWGFALTGIWRALGHHEAFYRAERVEAEAVTIIAAHARQEAALSRLRATLRDEAARISRERVFTDDEAMQQAGFAAGLGWALRELERAIAQEG